MPNQDKLFKYEGHLNLNDTLSCKGVCRILRNDTLRHSCLGSVYRDIFCTLHEDLIVCSCFKIAAFNGEYCRCHVYAMAHAQSCLGVFV